VEKIEVDALQCAVGLEKHPWRRCFKFNWIELNLIANLLELCIIVLYRTEVIKNAPYRQTSDGKTRATTASKFKIDMICILHDFPLCFAFHDGGVKVMLQKFPLFKPNSFQTTNQSKWEEVMHKSPRPHARET